MLSRFYSGLSGLQVPVPKYQFPAPYQQASRLTYYGSFFNSIEINSSFYKVPMPATVGKWAAMVAREFRFSFKLWRDITHVKNLEYDKAKVEKFMKAVNMAGDKKGCLLVQFPPSVGKEYFEQAEMLLKDIRELGGETWNVSVEFRNKNWYQQKVYEMLKSFHAGLVLHDMPGSVTPMIEQSTTFIYLRFHGQAGDYKGSYTEDFLAEYATYIHEWIQEGKMVYAYFNNTIGDAFKNVQLLNKMVNKTGDMQSFNV